MVSQRTIRFSEWSLKAVRALLVAALPLAVFTIWHTQPAPLDIQVDQVPKPVSEVQVRATHELDWYAPLWRRDLNQPPVPHSQPSPSRKPIQLPTLVATCVQSGRQLAHLRDRAGKLHLASTDETVESFRLLTIEPGRVELGRGEERHWLTLPQATGVNR